MTRQSNTSGRVRAYAMALCVGGCASAPPPATSSSVSVTSAASEVSYRFDIDLPGADATRLRVPTEGGAHRGAREPLVTIVEFTDMQCPFCRRASTTVRRLLELYPDTLAVVTRHNPLPFHDNALALAAILLEARTQQGDEGFYRLHDAIFALDQSPTPAEARALAAGLGFDAARMSNAEADETYAAIIRDDIALAARVGATGTPNFFVNGRQVTGAQPVDVFRSLIDEELALARLALADGVPRHRLYEAVQNGALADAPPSAPDPSPSAGRVPSPDPANVYAVPADGFPTRGPRDALVTIVEFTDFECPFCARVVPTLDRIVETYGDDVRIVVRNNPLAFHPHAQLAAEAALEIRAQKGDDAYFRFIALLFENTPELERAHLEDYALRVGADLPRFRRALDRHDHAPAVEVDRRLTTSLGAGGTPTFFINGHNLRGAQPFEVFRDVIDRELAEATRLVESGVARDALYAHVIRGGLTEAPPAGEDAPAPEPRRAYTPAFENAAPSLGPANAPVVIQLFTDMQCPFCDRVRPTLARILETYQGRVRIELRNYPLPFHQHAFFAAQVGREVFEQVGSEGFWQYYNAIFDAQRALSPERITEIARAIPRVSRRRLDAAIARDAHRALVQAEIDAVAASGMRIGTPSVLINGWLTQGAVPYETFAAEIDARLAASRGAP
jgi:protein-disulfide isomerase